MTVRKRSKSGTWSYVFRVNGKSYSGDTGLTVKRDALTEEKRLRNEVLEGQCLGDLYEQQRKHLVGKNPVALTDAWGKFVEVPRKKVAAPKRLGENLSRWNDWLAWVADQYPQVEYLYEVTPEMAEEYIRHIDTIGRYQKLKAHRKLKKLANNTKNEFRETCMRVFEYLAGKSGLAVNPFGHIPKLEKEAEARDSFSPKELTTIGEKSKGTPWLYHLMMVGLCTGMREGDVCLLRWDRVNLNDGWIERVKMGKTKKYIDVPIMPSLREYLDGLPHDDEYVLPELADRYKSGGVSRHVTAFLEDDCKIKTTRKVAGRSRPAKIKDVHSLRHTFCYMAALNGIPLPVVQGIVGHMSPEMTKTYMDHADRSTKQLMIKALPNHLAPDLKKVTTNNLTKDELIGFLEGLTDANWAAERRRMLDKLKGGHCLEKVGA